MTDTQAILPGVYGKRKVPCQERYRADARLRLAARLLDGETVAALCLEFGSAREGFSHGKPHGPPRTQGFQARTPPRRGAASQETSVCIERAGLVTSAA